jgi:hypothetical protein
MNAKQINGIIFVIIGIAVLSGAGFFCQQTIASVIKGKKSIGRVVEIKYSPSSVGRLSSCSYPVIAFSDMNGARYSAQGHQCGGNYWVNKKVEILYDPADPSRNKVNNFFEVWGILSVYLVISTVSLFLGILNIWQGNKSNK